MIGRKNKLMIWLTFGAVVMSILIHVLYRFVGVFGHHYDQGIGTNHFINVAQEFPFSLNLLLVIPILLLIGLVLIFIKNSEHPLIPMLITINLTLASISSIAGGGGSVEFHFSIFMVLAILAYYENIQLILIMTVLFALQHILGFFFLPELVFGVSTYSFIMLLTHAIFLILASGATILQIISKKRIVHELELDREKKQMELFTVLDSVRNLSQQLEESSLRVNQKSENNISSGEETLRSFKQVSSGLEIQSNSISNIDLGSQEINKMIQRTSSLSTDIQEKASHTESSVQNNHLNIKSLNEQIALVSETIHSAAETINALNESSKKVEGIITTIQDVAAQTNLLALNASIEAARAGEYGKGFAIVADEIRKLADQSNRATEEIHSILNTIKAESETSATKIEVGKKAVNTSVTKAVSAITSFDEMKIVVNQMTHFINDLNSSIKEIEMKSNSISNEISTISAITQQSLASMDELSAITEAQMASSKEVNKEIHQLKEMSQSLTKNF